jgi:hypothetical protein
MNPQGQNTSFIPQRPVMAPQKRGTRKVYVLTYVSYILFFATVFAAVGVFFYERFLDARLEVAKNRLIEEEGKFDQSQIASIKQLDDQIKLATGRMNEHLSLLPIFTELERTVAQSLKLSSFSYSREMDGMPKIEMTGEAGMAGNLLFQREAFTQSPLFVGASFEEVNINSAAKRDDDNRTALGESLETKVAFSVGKSLPKELLVYSVRAVPTDTSSFTEETSSQERVDNSAPSDGDEEVTTESEDAAPSQNDGI